MFEKLRTHLHCFEYKGKCIVVNRNTFRFDEIDQELYALLTARGSRRTKGREEKLRSLQRLENSLNAQPPFHLRYSRKQIVDKYAAQKVAIVNIVPSLKCNLNCDYCYSKDVRRSREPVKSMPPPLVDQTTDYILANLGTVFEQRLSIRFVGGGEPLTEYALIRRMVDRIQMKMAGKRQQARISYKLSTNGLLLDEEKLGFFKKHRFEIKISLDGGSRAANSHRLKRESDYDRLMANIRLAMRILGPEKITAAITFYGQEDLKRLVRECREIGFRHIRYQNAICANQQPRKAKVSLESMLAFYKKHLLTADLKRLVHLDSIDLALQTLTQVTNKYITCFGGVGDISIAPDGSIFTCNRFLGNSEFQIGQVSRGGIDQKRRKQYIGKITVRGRYSCHDCFMIGICGGKCVYNIYMQNNKQYAKTRETICNSFTADGMEKIIHFYLELREKRKEALNVIMTRGMF